MKMCRLIRSVKYLLSRLQEIRKTDQILTKLLRIR